MMGTKSSYVSLFFRLTYVPANMFLRTRKKRIFCLVLSLYGFQRINQEAKENKI